MSRFVLPLIVFLTTLTSAQAAEPSVTQMIETCRERYSSTTAVAQCVTEMRFDAAERRDAQLVESFRIAVHESEERDQEIMGRITELTESVEQLREQVQAEPVVTTQPQPAPQQEQEVQPQPVVQTQQQGYTYQQTGGIAWSEISRLTAMSIYSQFEGVERDTLHVTHLGARNSRIRCGGQGADYVILTNHGQPVMDMWMPEDREVLGFTELYYDRNSDGVPDQTVWAIDLREQDDVWVTWRFGDDFGLRYIRQSKVIDVGGVPTQLYRPTDINKDPVQVQSCRRDVLSHPGGHQGIPTYNLVRNFR